MRTTMKMILSTEWKEIWAIGKALGLVVLLLPRASYCILELPTASSGFLQPPRSYRDARNEGIGYFDRMKGGLDGWEGF